MIMECEYAIEIIIFNYRIKKYINCYKCTKQYHSLFYSFRLVNNIYLYIYILVNVLKTLNPGHILYNGIFEKSRISLKYWRQIILLRHCVNHLHALYLYII